MDRGSKKKICTIGVDVDTLQNYLYSYGYEVSPQGGINHIYTVAIPRLLDLFSAFGVKATFFIVGRDIENPANIPILKEIIRQGHEIGNHSMNHIYPFSALSREKKRQEICMMHQLALDKLGYKIKGFRAPGYGIDAQTLQILEEEGYAYDSSVHPTYLMPLINLCVLLISGFRKLPEMKSCLHFLSPLVPHKPRVGITEVPITVTPFIRMPFYGTFHLLSGKWIFGLGYYLLRKAGININYEVHAIEMLDLPETGLDGSLSKHPGLRIPWPKKEKNYQYILGRFKEDFDFRPIISLVEMAAQR